MTTPRRDSNYWQLKTTNGPSIRAVRSQLVDVSIRWFYLIFRSSPRRWPSRLELRCVRPSVRPYVHKKFFSDFHLIWCVGRPRPHMRTSVTSTRSKVKVKVTELPKLRKVHFSRSIFSAIPGKLSQQFKLRWMSIFHQIQMAVFRYCVILQSRCWARR